MVHAVTSSAASQIPSPRVPLCFFPLTLSLEMEWKRCTLRRTHLASAFFRDGAHQPARLVDFSPRVNTHANMCSFVPLTWRWLSLPPVPSHRLLVRNCPTWTSLWDESTSLRLEAQQKAQSVTDPSHV